MVAGAGLLTGAAVTSDDLGAAAGAGAARTAAAEATWAMLFFGPSADVVAGVVLVTEVEASFPVDSPFSPLLDDAAEAFVMDAEVGGRAGKSVSPLGTRWVWRGFSGKAGDCWELEWEALAVGLPTPCEAWCP